MLPLIEKLATRGPTLLLTTGTVTAAEVAKPRLPKGAIHQFVPIDTPIAVRRFLDHWKPDLALFAELELWPTTIRALRKRALPLAVVNARMSERSFRSWRRFAPLAHAVLRRADLFLAQTPADAERLRALGAERVVVCGNLKFDVPPPAADPALVEAMRTKIAGRPVLIAANTHPDEEAAVIAAHQELAKAGMRLVTIIAPRHRERGDEVAGLVDAAGLSLGRRSRGDEIGAATDIYLADTIGEMRTWYRLADIAFLGGSIVPHGGQNPIEPAKLGIPIIHGSHVGNFRDVYEALAISNAAAMVSDARTLAATVRRLIELPAERARLFTRSACLPKTLHRRARPHDRCARASSRPARRAAVKSPEDKASARPGILVEPPFACRLRVCGPSARSTERSSVAGWRNRAFR